MTKTEFEKDYGRTISWHDFELVDYVFRHSASVVTSKVIADNINTYGRQWLYKKAETISTRRIGELTVSLEIEKRVAIAIQEVLAEDSVVNEVR